MHSDLHIHLARELPAAPRSPISAPRARVALRPVGDADHGAVRRLATLDARPAPRGDVLLALVDDEPVAALSLDDGSVVADPFAPSAGAVELLQTRARSLQAQRGAAARRAHRRWRHGRRAAA